MIFLLGGFFNAVRGGQWRAWLNLKEEDSKYFIKSDYINALAFGLTVLILTGEWLLALLCVPAMMLGATPGWGDYIGALYGTRTTELQENKYIDKIIRRYIDRPFWWGFYGLSWRGFYWGICLALPFLFFGYTVTPILLLAVGAFMPVAYWAAGHWSRTRLQEGAAWPTAAWSLGEIFFGAILWSALEYL